MSEQSYSFNTKLLLTEMTLAEFADQLEKDQNSLNMRLYLPGNEDPHPLTISIPGFVF